MLLPPLPSRFVILSKKLKRRIQTQPPPPFLHDVTLFAVFFFEGVPNNHSYQLLMSVGDNFLLPD